MKHLPYSVAAFLLLACGASKSEDPPIHAGDKPIRSSNQPSILKPSAKSSKLASAGARVPDFSMTAHDGTTISTSTMNGRPWVLYFYPKDETPGCIAEAEGFRDGLAELRQLGARLVGVSMDTDESHQAFAKEHNLEFPLIADTEGKLARKFGVATERGFAERVTFVIDSNGLISSVFPRVVVREHVKAVTREVMKISKNAVAP